MVRGLFRCSGKKFFSSPNRPVRLWGSQSLPLNKCGIIFLDKSGRGVKLTTDINLIRTFKMIGAICPLHLRIFILPTGITLFVNFTLTLIHRYTTVSVIVGASHDGMAYSCVAVRGGGLQMWWAATNIVNQHSRTVDKGRYFSLEVGSRTADSSLWKHDMLQNDWQSFGLE